MIRATKEKLLCTKIKFEFELREVFLRPEKSFSDRSRFDKDVRRRQMRNYLTLVKGKIFAFDLRQLRG